MTETILLIALIVFDIIVIPIAIYLMVKSHRQKGTLNAQELGMDDQITVDVLSAATIAKWCTELKLAPGSSCITAALSGKQFDPRRMPAALRKVADRAYMLIAQDENHQKVRTCLIVCNTTDEELSGYLKEGNGIFVLDI